MNIVILAMTQNVNFYVTINEAAFLKFH